jgi:hypothetical protein
LLIVRAGAVLTDRGRRCGTPGTFPGGLLHLPHLHLLLSHHETPIPEKCVERSVLAAGSCGVGMV